MDEVTRNRLTVAGLVILLAAVWGLLQRRKVARELEERLAAARSRPSLKRKPGRIPVENDQPEEMDESGRDNQDTGL